MAHAIPASGVSPAPSPPHTVTVPPQGDSTTHVAANRREMILALHPAEQAFWILRIGFAALPIIAGADKFFERLVDWDKYLSPTVTNLIGSGNVHTFMLVVGVVEMIAGLGVAIAPRIFAYVVAAWLIGIIVNLLSIPGYYDIALRDLGLALGALALGRLSAMHWRVTSREITA